MSSQITRIAVIGEGDSAAVAGIYVAKKLRKLNLNITIILMPSQVSDIVCLSSDDLANLKGIGIGQDVLIGAARAEIDLGVMTSLRNETSAFFNDFDLGGMFAGCFFNDLIARENQDNQPCGLDDLAWYAHIDRRVSSGQLLAVCEKNNLPFGLRLRKDDYINLLVSYCGVLGIEVAHFESSNGIGAISHNLQALDYDLVLDVSDMGVVAAEPNACSVRRFDLPAIYKTQYTAERSHGSNLCYRVLDLNSNSVGISFSFGGQENKAHYSLVAQNDLVADKVFTWEYCTDAWTANCVAIGAATVSAPNFLFGHHLALFHRLATLIELWPTEATMPVCARAFNHRHCNHAHKLLELSAISLFCLLQDDLELIITDLWRRIKLFELHGKIPVREGDILPRMQLYKLYNFLGLQQGDFDLVAKQLPLSSLGEYLNRHRNFKRKLHGFF